MKLRDLLYDGYYNAIKSYWSKYKHISQDVEASLDKEFYTNLTVMEASNLCEALGKSLNEIGDLFDTTKRLW